MNNERSTEGGSTDPVESCRAVEWRQTLLLVCAVAMLAAAILRAQPLQSANDRSRWCTVWSLVERGTYQIDEIDRKTRFSTIDKVRHRTSEDQPWHFYSSKPPLLSTMVAAVYWIQRQTLGWELFAYTTVVTRMLLTVVNLLPMSLALISMNRSLRLLGASENSRLFLLATAGLGSMLNPYLTTLNNHTPAAICIIFSISAMVRIEAARHAKTAREPASGDFAALGLSAAFASSFELPAALFGVISFLFAARVDWRKTAAWFVPAALIPLAAFFVTNWICTGGIKPFYAYYGTEKYVYVHEGVPSYWSQPRDLDANTETWPVYLFHCVLGHHGILSLSPVLLLTLAGWLIWLSGTVRMRPEKPTAGIAKQHHAEFSGSGRWSGVPSSVMLTGLVCTLVTLLFYLTRTENYNYGGNSVALRWMLWLTPFWWFAMLPALEKILPRRRMAITALALLALSITSANWSQDRPWRPSWLYEVMENAGWISYRTPRSP